MARAWHLMSRPDGLPTADNFALKEHALPEMGDGMVHVRNLFLSVDPYMRGRMNEAKSYIPPFAIDAPMEGGALGEVVASNADGFAPGDLVVHMAGWRDEAVVPAKGDAEGAADPRRRAAGVPRHPRHARRDGLLRAARRGRGQGQRHRLRLGRGRRGRIGGGADRQGQGHDRHRLGRRAGEVRVRPLTRRRRGDRLQGRLAARIAARSGARGHRRLFRQCRRRASRRGLRPLAAARALRAVRDDRGLQQPRTDRLQIYDPRHRDADHRARLPLRRLRLAARRILPRHGRSGWRAGRSSRRTPSSTASSARPTRSSACSAAPIPGRCWSASSC